jgi:protein farnesyltransferase subunit beta
LEEPPRRDFTMSTLHLTPSIYTLPHQPLPSNSHPSATLYEQADTEQLISELLSLTAPPAVLSLAPTATVSGATTTTLRKNEHTQYLASNFFKLPGAYVSLDASRPWLMFWTVHSLDLLGVGLDQATKDR